MPLSLRDAIKRAGWKAKMKEGRVSISRQILPDFVYEISLPPMDTQKTVEAIASYEFKDEDVVFGGDMYQYLINLNLAEKALISFKENIKKDMKELLE